MGAAKFYSDAKKINMETQIAIEQHNIDPVMKKILGNITKLQGSIMLILENMQNVNDNVINLVNKHGDNLAKLNKMSATNSEAIKAVMESLNKPE